MEFTLQEKTNKTMDNISENVNSDDAISITASDNDFK